MVRQAYQINELAPHKFKTGELLLELPNNKIIRNRSDNRFFVAPKRKDLALWVCMNDVSTRLSSACGTYLDGNLIPQYLQWLNIDYYNYDELLQEGVYLINPTLTFDSINTTGVLK
jgi:hypothetical protein